MARIREPLDDGAQHHFMQLTGIHPRRVGVATHWDAIRYLAHIDLHNRQRQELQPQAGLLALMMGRAKQPR